MRRPGRTGGRPDQRDLNDHLHRPTISTLVDKQRLAYEQLLCRRAAPGQRAHQVERVAVHRSPECCRRPVEFNLAHAPEEVHYPSVNHDLLRECRILVLAMTTTWRWDRGDQLSNGRPAGHRVAQAGSSRARTQRAGYPRLIPRTSGEGSPFCINLAPVGGVVTGPGGGQQ